MAVLIEQWELILHHSYSGIPGVIFDQSPGRTSHGTAVNLTPAAFHADGATAGSGAVTFPIDGYIQVPTSPQSWAPLGGIRVEILCRCETVEGGGTLFDAGSFSLSVDGGFFRGTYATNAGSSTFISGASPGIHGPVPDNEWVPIGLLYDGFSVLDCTVRGTGAFTEPGPHNPLDTTTMLVIGNNRAGTDGWTGSIDDIKIWRLDPRYIDSVFTNRPVDAGVEQCWVDWVRSLNEVLDADPDCANVVRNLIGRAAASVLRVAAGDTDTEGQWEFATQRYADLWSQNRLEEIVPVFVDLFAWLRSHGLDPAQNADLQALVTNDCFSNLGNKIPPLNCDAQFTGFLDDLSASLQAL